MEPIPYTVKLKAPASIRIVDYNDSDQRIYVSSVAMRHSMRKTLDQLTRDYHLSPDIEFELFGELRPDGYARASAFRISGAFGAVSTQKVRSKARITLPSGAILKGFLETDVPNNSPEELAIFMSLIGVNALKTTSASGNIPCVVSVNTSRFDLEKIYTSASSWNQSVIDRIARNWLPKVRRAIVTYFSTRPEEMYEMPSRAFEKLVAELLKAKGFDVTLTPETRDGGYDLLAIQHKPVTGKNVVLIECKRYAQDRSIGVGLVRNLVGVVQIHDATKGMLITTSWLSSPAQRLVTSHSSKLVAHDYESLVNWLKDCSIA